MTGEAQGAGWRRLGSHLADACVLAALLLVLALSWQGRPPGATGPGLGEAAREAVARQVGMSPAAPRTARTQAPREPSAARRPGSGPG